MKKTLTRIVALVVALIAGYLGVNKGMLSDEKTVEQTEQTADEDTPASTEVNAFYDSNDIILPAKPKNWKSKVPNVIRHKYYALLYDTRHNTPAWVTWRLTAAHTRGDQQRSQKFWADPLIPRPYRVDFYDYRAEWDRGHMCPAGDNKWSQQAMYECFYMSNMCPQDHILNTESWEKLESACRRWAQSEGAIYIVCGPVYKNVRHLQIGQSHKVDVPEGFFKAVLSTQKGREKAIAFYFDNNSTFQDYKKIAVSVDAIEEIIGIDLFADLDDALEDRIEAKANIRDWKK